MKRIQILNRIPKEEKYCRGKRILRFFSVCIVCIVFLCVSAFADDGRGIQEEKVVTLVWEGSNTDVKTTEWNVRSVQIHTEDVGMGNGKVYDYIGVTLLDLMKLAGADECTKALVKSTDGLIGEVSAADIRNYDIALVNGYADGKPIKAGAGGPLKIVFPVTEHPELRDSYSFRSWKWYVCEVNSSDSRQMRPPGRLSGALNMLANLENSAVATGLEQVSFHSNPKERQCQSMLKLPHNCTHLTH